MGEGKGDAFRAGRDDIDALTAVVGKGWAKGIGAVVRSGEGKTEGGGRRSRMGDCVGRTRQRVWDRGARGVRR